MSREWREHPKLRQRFHPDAQDDLQVIVHDGGPRLSGNSPELVWVTVTGASGGDLFTGRILNQPQQLKSVSQATEIKFVALDGEYPVMVTEKYLSERNKWEIHGCNNCGFNELLDAPSDLMRVIFPNLPPDATMERFTSFCGICGGVQVVQNKNTRPIQDEAKPNTRTRKWWEFWR